MRGRLLPALVLLCLPLSLAASAAEEFEGDAAARAKYDLMIATMRKAKTLSYASVYRSEAADFGRLGRCVYRIWMKKPNRVRLEASLRGEVKGILVGDGEHFWTYWPQGRPEYESDRKGDAAKEYQRTKYTCYLKKRSPKGAHSIGHETGPLGVGLTMPILDPSTFHGYTDSLQRYIDGVRSCGEEKLKEEECDVVEVSIMRGQRTWKIWLSKRDHLPRRLVQTLRVRTVYTTVETWSRVRIDEEIPDEKFDWKPPEGWVEYRRPEAEEGLLDMGRPAPDFDLPLDGGGRFRLSAHRGKVVWFNVWRAG